MRDPGPVQNPAIRLIGNSSVPIWGLDGAARLTRTLRKFGMTDIAPWPAPDIAGPYAVLIDAGYLIEDNLLRKLIASPGTYLQDPVSGHVAAAHIAAVNVLPMTELMQRNVPLGAGGLPAGVSAAKLSLSEAWIS